MAVDVKTGMHIPKNPDRFTFDEEVTAVFDNMAERSLPMYGYANQMITSICNQLQPSKGHSVWDFGASTGEGLIAAADGIAEPLVEYYGVDVSEPMLERMTSKFPMIIPVHHDFEVDQDIPALAKKTHMKVAIWNWTLQFLQSFPLRRRLLTATYHALEDDGCLVLCEKYKSTSVGPSTVTTEKQNIMPAMHDSLMQAEYLRWRRKNGYKASEIIAKSQALGNSMFPWARHEAIQSLEFAGFKRENIFGLYQMYGFGGLVAYK